MNASASSSADLLHVEKQEVSDQAGSADNASGSGERFEARELTATLILVTYDVEGAKPSQRSSIWRRWEIGWKLVFHQGTPTS